jgi:predicted AlkP superfamily pyrophosphatase or phosphodiesterase
MKTSLWFVICVLLVPCYERATASGQAEHVVVVVWDGMRPDFVTPQYTPTLYELARRGTFFLNHHSVYVTSTEVNGTALATGMQPEHSGVMANTEYRPDLNWLGTYGTESLDAVRRGDLLSGGHYLEAATVAEVLQQAGFPTIIAGAKPVVLLHDRTFRKTNDAQKDSVTLFRGQTLPRSVLDALVRAGDVGPFPDRASTNSMLAIPATAATGSAATNAAAENAARGRGRGGGRGGSAAGGGVGTGAPTTPDSWTTRALVRGLWRKGVPKYSLLWLSEPDSSQHDHGVGSEETLAALASSDNNLAQVLQALETKGVLEKTDVFVVSDHGFSTINRGPSIIESLRRAKFIAGRQFQNPETGDVMVISLGGSALFYVFDRDEAVIRWLVSYLQGSDFAGVVFCGLPIDGTFSLNQVHIGVTNNAPDVVISLRWSGEPNEFGAPGLVTAIDGGKGLGTHSSLSRFDLHNTLVAAGPDFKQGFVSDLPSGNIDVAPTVLAILGVGAPCPMDGRVLTEAMTRDAPPPPEAHERRIEASRAFGFREWHQYLRFTQIGSAVYYDEGNGESILRSSFSAPRD